MATEEIPHEITQKILELYLCSDDPRIKHISTVLNVTESNVIDTIQAHTQQMIPFLGGRFKILNSEINYKN